MSRAAATTPPSAAPAWLPLLPVLAIYGGLFALGLFVPDMRQLAAKLAFYCALAQAFNVFMGLTGYVDFGYVAFVGIGAYGMAVCLNQAETLGLTAVPLGLFTGIAASCLLALAVGAVALRLRGAYFAIATVGVNEGLRYLILGLRLFGGSQGMIYIGKLTKVYGRQGMVALTTFWADTFVFLIAASAAAATLLCMRSRLGYALRALRSDEDAARAVGVNVTAAKIAAFLLSAVMAGALGAVAWGLKDGYVYPATAFEVHYTVEAIIIVLIGGAGTLQGPVVGGLVYGLLKHLLSIYIGTYQLLLFAPLLIAVIIFFPEGLMGYLLARLRTTRLGPWIL